MSVKLGPYGFCNGVKHAISAAIEGAKKYGKVYCLHPLIHNKSVVTDLVEKGVLLTDEKDLPEGCAVVISAHGTDPITEKRLKEKGHLVIDLTCPLVKVIHDRVKQASDEGKTVLIAGDKDHAEVKGTVGFCKRYQVIGKAEEADLSRPGDILLCAQTTFCPESFKIIAKNIKILAEKCAKTVEVFNSICYNTVARQEAAVSLSKESDVILVVGDRESSNCNKLLDTAEKYCESCHFIENVTDLSSVQIKKYSKVGILSGASTPEVLSLEVFYSMSEEQKVIDTVDENNIEEVSAPVAEEVTSTEKDFGSMEEAMKVGSKYSPKNYREGKRLKTKVVSADVNGITVTIEDGGKNDCGFISCDEAELDDNYDPDNYKVDDEIEAIVIPKKAGDNKTMINLSKKAFDAIKLDDEKVKDILAGNDFKLVISSVTNGGLLGKIGTYTVFVPASQIRIGFVKNLEDYVGKELRLRAIPPKEEVDEEGNVKKPRSAKRIVASQKVILEEEKKAKEEEFWSKIYVGARVTGKVKRFADFGAFVSLKYMDALVRNSELSWSKKRIMHPSEVLELNKTYEFVVKTAERSEDGKNDKISLSYKDLQKKPWEIAMEKYPVGTVLTGKVARIMKYGAFVELEPGIDGLVHISQINHGWVANASEALKEGDEVEVKVMSYENERITLSIKELLEAPAVEEKVEEETTETRPSRTAAFNKRLEGQDKGERKEKKGRRVKEEDDGEPREYVSNGSGVTLGDLFKINLSTEDEDKE
ncbi:MAG: 4-hydroxy-3-methylbut-2-enyl diphosphate reductase [Clostridia bacterium]|nr:4-hydroxy-3-methylbut-2-enyl diphosphate reductase [Clostridia bacterium]